MKENLVAITVPWNARWVACARGIKHVCGMAKLLWLWCFDMFCSQADLESPKEHVAMQYTVLFPQSTARWLDARSRAELKSRRWRGLRVDWQMSREFWWVYHESMLWLRYWIWYANLTYVKCDLRRDSNWLSLTWWLLRGAPPLALNNVYVYVQEQDK